MSENVSTNTGDAVHAGHEASARERRRTVALALLVVFGLGGVFGLSRWMELHRPPVDARLEEERLYVTGRTARRLSLSFSGVVADWYWMRSLQYVGRKMLTHRGEFQLDDLSPLDLKILPQLLDTATTLDPQFMAVYEYGAVVLPAINDNDAIALLEKGVAANPGAWRLYHHLGYIYWRRQDYQSASAAYETGAQLPGAPNWMKAMSVRMRAEGGSRALAREMYQRMYDEAGDKQVQEMAAYRLMQLASLDERDAIRRVLEDYKARNGRCVASWGDVAAELRRAQLPPGSLTKQLRFDSSGAPVDPADMAYRFVNGNCDVDLDPRSKVPYK